MSADAERSQRIDTMRGIACVLLVLYHVIGPSPDTGLRIPTHGWLRGFNDVLVYFRMPMFAFLSGLVYALRPFDGNLPKFLSGKFRRLIIPMLIVGTAFFWVQSVAPGVNMRPGSWTTMHLYPVAHFWFLESMFLIFVLIALLDGAKWLDRRAAVALALALAAAASAQDWVPLPEILSIDGSVYLLPYFLLGLFVQRFGIGRAGLAAAIVVLVAAIVSLAWIFTCCSWRLLPDRSGLAAVMIGASACVVMNASRLRVAWLAKIGVYSFGIYMFHVFFTAGSRVALQHLGVDAVAVLGVVGCLVGIAGPILLERATRRHAPPRVYRWVFGAKAGSQRRPPAATTQGER
jgi:surface polysaccharide O-acyltransferase-like enzyme